MHLMCLLSHAGNQTPIISSDHHHSQSVTIWVHNIHTEPFQLQHTEVSMKKRKMCALSVTSTPNLFTHWMVHTKTFVLFDYNSNTLPRESFGPTNAHRTRITTYMLSAQCLSSAHRCSIHSPAFERVYYLAFGMCGRTHRPTDNKFSGRTGSAYRIFHRQLAHTSWDKLMSLRSDTHILQGRIFN